MNGSRILGLAALAVAVGVSLTVEDRFAHNVLFLTFLAAGLGQAWNIVGGFLGRSALGHAAYFALGAYTSTLLFLRLGLSPWLGMVAGAALAALAGALVERVTWRLSGSYYALATYAFAAALFILARGWRSLTLGAMGLVIPFQPSLAGMVFESPKAYTLLALLYGVAVLAAAAAVLRSRLGFFLRALRDDEQGAMASGVNPRAYKVLAGMLSAALAACGGTLYAQFLLFVDPDTVLGVDVTLRFLLVTIIGGTGTLAGPLLGAAILVPSERLLIAEFGSTLRGAHLLFFGPLLAAIVIFMPNGVRSLLEGAVRRVQKAYGAS